MLNVSYDPVSPFSTPYLLSKIKRQIQYDLDEHQRDDEDTGDDSKRHRELQAIDTLNKAADKIDEFLKTKEPRMGKGQRPKEVKSNITDNQSAKMKTSKGTIQGYNGVATVDKKHQVIVDVHAFGEGQEHHTLIPVLNRLNHCFKRIGINDDLLKTGVIITADTGFANEANMRYLHDNKINGYIPDNPFRSRDSRFSDQKVKYGKRHQSNKSKSHHGKPVIPASEFSFDGVAKRCVCPAGKSLWLKDERLDAQGQQRYYFEGRLTDCRDCAMKHDCMKNPESANNRKGHGRQGSFKDKSNPTPSYTGWMKPRVDSQEGKLIYSHRMSVVEPVFGNIGTNKGLNRFSLRGKVKVQLQWRLYCLVHNIEKLLNDGNMDYAR